MILDRAKNYALIALFVLAGGLGLYARVLHADNRALEAEVKPLSDGLADAGRINASLRQAITQCEADKLAMRKANEKAVEEAQREKEEAEKRAEAYLKLLGNPPADCAAVLAMQICPALADY